MSKRCSDGSRRSVLFDLSLIAARYPELVRLAEEARAEMGRLRRRATIARKGITQILETAADPGLKGEDWASLARETRTLAKALKKVERSEEMVLGLESLERRQRSARERLENLLSQAMASSAEAVDSAPLGSENDPHQDTYSPTLNPIPDTVIADEQCNAPAGEVVSIHAAPEPPPAPQATKPVRLERLAGTVLKLSTEELVQLAPRLRPYLTVPTPTCPAIVDAADWLRGELGVSKSLWGEACQTMGREEAVIAVAIVSAKPGELNLAQTIWGLRSRERRAGGGDARSPRRTH